MSGTHFAVVLDRKLTGLRLHAVPRDAALLAPRARDLLALHARAEAERQAIEAQRRAVGTCLSAIETAVRDVPRLITARLDEIAGIATELGLALARGIVGELVDRHLTDVGATVARCMDAVGNDPRTHVLKIRVNSDDLATVQAALHAAGAGPDRLAGAELVADASLRHGSVRIDSDAGCTLFDPRAAIERVCAEVLEGLAS